MEQSKFVFECLVIKEGIGFTALCLDVDVASEGSTIAEAKENVREAVTLYIESAIENNLPIIRPVPAKEIPQITRPGDVVEAFTIGVNVQVTAHV